MDNYTKEIFLRVLQTRGNGNKSKNWWRCDEMPEALKDFALILAGNPDIEESSIHSFDVLKTMIKIHLYGNSWGNSIKVNFKIHSIDISSDDITDYESFMKTNLFISELELYNQELLAKRASDLLYKMPTCKKQYLSDFSEEDKEVIFFISRRYLERNRNNLTEIDHTDIRWIQKTYHENIDVAYNVIIEGDCQLAKSHFWKTDAEFTEWVKVN
jgi:replicative superfamily II helicase